MDGWNTTFLFGRPIFRGYVSFKEGNRSVKTQHLVIAAPDLVREIASPDQSVEVKNEGCDDVTVRTVGPKNSSLNGVKWDLYN